MRLTEQLMKGATDLYQLAFLITGSGELAAELAADAIASERALRLRHLHVTLWTPRLLVIEEALAAVVDEFVTSARRTVTNQPDLSDLPPANWKLDPDTTPTDLERALLDIDVFPRCAILLTVFEGLPVDTAAFLMNTNANLVRTGVAFASAELTRRLAEMQGWVRDAAPVQLHLFLGKLRYA